MVYIVTTYYQGGKFGVSNLPKIKGVYSNYEEAKECYEKVKLYFKHNESDDVEISESGTKELAYILRNYTDDSTGIIQLNSWEVQ